MLMPKKNVFPTLIKARRLIGLQQWSLMGAKSPSKERFYALWGVFLIYQILGAISASRGAISAG